MLDIYTPETADRWEAAFAAFPPSCRTLFHAPAYVLSWAEYESGAPVCLHLRLGERNFLYAFYVKPVPGPLGRGLSDIESPYGHGGLLCDAPDPDPALLEKANDAIDDWCAGQGIVAEFVREYPGRPYLRRSRKLQVRHNLFHRYVPGQDFAAAIKKRARRDAAAARKRGCTASVRCGTQGLEAFEPLYAGLCRDKGLVESHGFGEPYFRGVRRHLARESLLVSVEAEGKLVAASLALRREDALVYHLSASLPEGKALLANDLLLYSLLEHGAGAGCAYAFLGGGLSDSPEDSLYRFKEKFATDAVATHIGVKVHDQAAYERLCADWERRNPEKAARYGRFFLKYRM
jgi:hypothetical protein